VRVGWTVDKAEEAVKATGQWPEAIQVVQAFRQPSIPLPTLDQLVLYHGSVTHLQCEVKTCSDLNFVSASL
jgi:hypothetical protein